MKYAIGDFIGEDLRILKIFPGGMGLVYLCEDVNQKGVYYAIKTVKNDDQVFLDLLLQECKKWFDIGLSPNVIKCYFFFKIDDQYFIKLQGVINNTFNEPNLRAFIRDTRKKSVNEVISIISDVCNGLHYILRNSPDFVHGDLKPENILIDDYQQAFITDLGLSKIQNGTKNLGGSAYYKSPEQWNNKNFDIRSDIYSIGCIFYELFFGSPPFIGSLDETEFGHLYGIPSFEPQLNLPKALIEIISKCLEKNPNDRFQSIAHLKYSLRELSYLMGNDPEDTYDKNGINTQTRVSKQLWLTNNSGELRNRARIYKFFNEFDLAIKDLDTALYLSRYPVTKEVILTGEEVLHVNFAINLSNTFLEKAEALFSKKKYFEALINCCLCLKFNPTNNTCRKLRGQMLSKLEMTELSFHDFMICDKNNSSNELTIEIEPTWFVTIDKNSENFKKILPTLDWILKRINSCISNGDKNNELIYRLVSLEFGNSTLKDFSGLHPKISSILNQSNDQTQDANQEIKLTENEIANEHSIIYLLSELSFNIELIPYFFHDKYLSINSIFKPIILTLLKFSEFDEAITILETISDNFKNKDFYELSAKAYFGKEDYEKSLIHIDKVIAFGIDNEEINILKGDILWSLGEYEESIIFFKKALAFRQDNVLTMNKLFNSLIKAGLTDEAFREIEKAKDLDSNNSHTFYSLAGYYQINNELDLAIEMMNRSIELDLTNWQLYQHRAVLFGLQGKFEKAIEDFDKLVSLNSNKGMSEWQRGNMLFSIGNYSKALEDHSLAIMHQLRNGSFRAAFGFTLFQLGLKNEALANLKFAKKLRAPELEDSTFDFLNS